MKGYAEFIAEAKKLNIFIDGIEGKEVPFSKVPGGNRAFQYVIGRTMKGGEVSVFRRSIAQRGTYGGWRWEVDMGKLLKK